MGAFLAFGADRCRGTRRPPWSAQTRNARQENHLARHATIPRKRSYRCHLDRWLDEVMRIEGLPIPYGAPNASPHIEHLMRTLREEALDHFIFLTADHIRRVVREYVRYYNGARPSQAIQAIPDPYPELREPPLRGGKLVALPVLGGVQHDYRLVA
jgi:hypothetical protein